MSAVRASLLDGCVIDAQLSAAIVSDGILFLAIREIRSYTGEKRWQ